ncbi:MAG: enoyl-CoA hydratase/isomerase family protein [Candidatus Lambdaproteobacteria bacterium]|nr:enoyl-CoA hydratase/isomerase family protein [Candidatus Lambdaproteobacteria bacterium]
MSTNVVTYESHEHIAVITMNRPEKHNALNGEIEEGLHQAWLRFRDSDDRVAILTGAGQKAFTAGADLYSPPEIWRFTPGVGVELEKPVIAAVNGVCVGGGVVLVQFADLCVAAEHAVFSYPEAKVALCGGLISSVAARIPHKLAMEMILLGEKITAQRAYEFGLVNKVVPQTELMAAAMGYARTLADNAPLVLSLLKRFVGRVLPKGPSELAGIGRRDVAVVMSSQDAEEGKASFREKRKPVYVGR